MNNVSLIGRLTADPEIRSDKKGKLEIARFTLAVDRVGSEDADFIRCVAFGKSAEFVEDYFQKGLRVGVSGRIQTGRYEDKDSGKTVFTTDVIVERLDFADGNRNQEPKEEKSERSSRTSAGRNRNRR